MKNKKNIAMRCNQEQFEAIKPKLEKAGEIGALQGAFVKYKYLTNNFGPKMGCFDFIGNDSYWEAEHGNNIYEQWNEKIFLEACGIETMPTLEEVKAYFKDAKTAECLTQKSEENISSPKGKGIHYDMGIYWIEAEGVTGKYTNLWESGKGYAKILTYKTPKFEITKETVIKYQMKEEFPEVFEVKLEIGKWYIVTNIKSGSLGFEGIGQYTKEKPQSGLLETDLGFNFRDVRGRIWRTNGDIRLATPEEVTEALKNEAVMRYKVGDIIEDLRNYYKGEYNNMIFGSVDFRLEKNGAFYVRSTNKYWTKIMNSSGQWATVIKTKTIQQAEELLKELGHEIKIVS